jgi:hypothetical protein
MSARRPLPTLLATAVVGASCVFSAPAGAWGLKTHLWIAEKVLADVQNGCDVDLGLGPGKRYALNEEVCQALRQHPAEFRAGVLGPDVFPDFVVGQVTTHPGTNAEPHINAPGAKWAAGQYMSRLLERASTPAELAFAYGYLVHGAGDVFAHTYVNNYAGDIFDLKDERRVELRHFVLEKYIEARTPLPPTLALNDATVRVPAPFVATQLIFDDALHDQYANTVAALHVKTMQELYQRERSHGLQAMVAKADKAARSIAAKLVALRQRLSGEREALKSVRQTQPLSAQLLDAARDRLLALQKPDALDLLRTLPSDTKARAAGLALPAPASALANAAERLRAVEDAAEDAQADQRSSEALDTVLGLLEADRTSSAGTPPDDAARKILADSDAMLHAAERMSRAGSLPGAADVLPGTRQALASARPALIATLRKNVELLSDQEKEADALEKQASSTLGWLRFRQAMADNRLDGIEQGTRAYVDASMAGALDVMNGRGSPLAAYDDWRKCWLMAYAGVPYQWTRTSCRVKKDLEEVRKDIDRHVEKMIAGLPFPFPQLAKSYKKVRNRLQQIATKEAWSAAYRSVEFISNDRDKATVDFIRLMGSPSHTAADLVAAYRLEEDDRKDLLLLPDIDKLVDTDLATRDSTPHPEEFQALRHAVTLAKLSLLSLDTVNDMVRDIVGKERSVQFPDGDPLYPRGGARTSILPLMVKSIDGNHQWQAYGIPYPRAHRPEAAFKPTPQRYGYNAYTEKGYGMRLFADQNARTMLFARLFPTPFIGAINGRMQDAAMYPFMTCDAVPFPVTTLADGRFADADTRCMAPPPAISSDAAPLPAPAGTAAPAPSA